MPHKVLPANVTVLIEEEALASRSPLRLKASRANLEGGHDILRRQEREFPASPGLHYRDRPLPSDRSSVPGTTYHPYLFQATSPYLDSSECIARSLDLNWSDMISSPAKWCEAQLAPTSTGISSPCAHEHPNHRTRLPEEDEASKPLIRIHDLDAFDAQVMFQSIRSTNSVRSAPLPVCPSDVSHSAASRKEFRIPSAVSAVAYLG